MRILAWLVFACLLAATGGTNAANTPCSGKKGGVSHCANGKFVCNDGSISASKKVCAVPGKARQQPVPNRITDANAACPCSSGRMCTGPRGGRYCLTPSGNKSYQRK